MSSATFTVRVDSAVKKRLEKLAKSTGRSRSYLTGQAIGDYLDLNEWQIEGIKRGIESIEREGGIPHEEVEQWIRSWGSGKERRMPKPRKS